jgi:hypothetical protein
VRTLKSCAYGTTHFRILNKGDHYMLLFWRQNKFRKSPRMWPTYVLGVLAAAGLWLLVLFFFGTRGGMMRGQRRAAGTGRQIYSVFEPTGSTHFAVPLPAGPAFRGLPPALFQTG